MRSIEKNNVLKESGRRFFSYMEFSSYYRGRQHSLWQHMFDTEQSNPGMINLWGFLEITQSKSHIKNKIKKKNFYHQLSLQMRIGLFKMRRLELKSPGSNCNLLSIIPYYVFQFGFKISIWVKWWTPRQDWRYPCFITFPLTSAGEMRPTHKECSINSHDHAIITIYSSMSFHHKTRAIPVSKLVIMNQKASASPKIVGIGIISYGLLPWFSV